ncbi:MAG TPA: glutamate mutase L [Anaerolineales bacterium]
MTSLAQGESVLAVDVGGATTRAVLFDIVEGAYRFVASGSAASTAEAPFRDVSAGARAAITDLQTLTGRSFLDADGRLITPSQADGSGVDALVSTLSAGPTLRTVVLGLLSEVSLASGRRLAETSYTRIVDSVGIDDPRQADQQIDELIRLQPDAVIIVGGADGGASRSVQKIIEPIGLSSYLLAPEKRPAVLFAGNQRLQVEVKELLGSVVPSLRVGPNVRPSLELEDLQPAARELASLYLDVRKRQLQGVEQLESWSQGTLLPTAYAQARMLRFLGRVYGGARGAVLGVDLGASAAVVTAGFKSGVTLKVYPQFGLGEDLPGLLQYASLEDILRWSPLDISAGALRDFLYQKSLYPSSVAVTTDEQALAQAVARQALFLAMQKARRDFPAEVRTPRPGLLPYFEPIIASGAAFGDAPTPAHGLLLLLDGIQPVGIATIIFDRNNLLPLLGAAAEYNCALPVQVLDSGAFESLGTVVSLHGAAAAGSTIARARLVYENGAEAMADIKAGNLELLPLPHGQNAKLAITPRHGVNAGFGPGKAGVLTISGGTMGVVFDGRGRPLNLPNDPGRRRELLKKWLWTVGG